MGCVGGVGRVHIRGRDVKSAFNSLDRDAMYDILKEHPKLQSWVDHLLSPRSFDIYVDGQKAARRESGLVRSSGEERI